MKSKLLKQKVYFSFFRIVTAVVVGFLLFMIGTFLYNGIGVIDWTFLTDIPRKGMTEGGIFPAIVLHRFFGTIL